MADVQLEHGYVKLTNRLLEAILASGFGVSQMYILLALFRVTYGWRRSTVRCTETELATWSGMKPGPEVTRAGGTFRKALNELIKEGVIRRVDGGRGSHESTFSIQKDFTKWGGFSSAEAKLQAMYGTRPLSDDTALKASQRAEREAADMAQERANSKNETWPESGPSNEGATWPGSGPRAETTWPDTGPPHGPTPGHVDGPKSLNGETYSAGKTLKDSSTPLGDIDLLPQQASLGPENAPPTAVAEREPPTDEPLPNRVPPHAGSAPATAEQSRPAQQNPEGRTETADVAESAILLISPIAGPSRARAAGDIDPASPAVAYAVAMSTALNLGITRRWTEQPMPVHYVTGLQLAEELVAAGVPIDLARATITSVCLASKNERPPKTLGYFREPILEAFRGAEQRALNDAAARGGAAKRGLAPIANVVSADRANGERADRAAYDVARRAAATAWINDPANRAALARVKHTLDEKYAKIAESGWKARAYEADFVIAIAETVGFPNFETWAAQRTPATSGVA